MLNVLTIDVEDWFHICGLKEGIKFEDWGKCESRVEKNTLKLLNLLDKNGVKATFFFLGWIAEKYPELISQVEEKGHEIASHGYAHKLIYEMSKDEFKEDLEKSLKIIGNLSKGNVIGYRGAGFSIIKENLWVFEIMAELGIKYDSTIFPITRGHGGLPGAPRRPYKINTSKGEIWEFPLSTINFLGKRLAFSGGGYLRLFPYWFIKRAARKVNKECKPVIFYIHPREFDINQPRIKMPLNRRFKSYVNLASTEEKIKALFRDFKFVPFKEMLG